MGTGIELAVFAAVALSLPVLLVVGVSLAGRWWSVLVRSRLRLREAQTEGLDEVIARMDRRIERLVRELAEVESMVEQYGIRPSGMSSSVDSIEEMTSELSELHAIRDRLVTQREAERQPV